MYKRQGLGNPMNYMDPSGHAASDLPTYGGRRTTDIMSSGVIRGVASNPTKLKEVHNRSRAIEPVLNMAKQSLDLYIQGNKKNQAKRSEERNYFADMPVTPPDNPGNFDIPPEEFAEKYHCGNEKYDSDVQKKVVDQNYSKALGLKTFLKL